MSEKKIIKNSAYYQKLYRQRLRDQGLVKKEVWILSDYSDEILEVEKAFRIAKDNKNQINSDQGENMKQPIWTVEGLCEALQTSNLVAQKSASVELIDGVNASIHVVMHDFGDLPIFLTVSNQQILVESLLWPVDWVKDQEKLNFEILITRKIFPLSTVGIECSATGRANYIMYGALSSTSILMNIIYELEMLADNVIKVTEAYEDFLDIDL